MINRMCSRLAASCLLALLPAVAGAASFKTLYAFQGGSDGAQPDDGLLHVGGKLYGTTFYGGGSANCTGGCGTVFSVNRKTGAERVVYTFQGTPDGCYPFTGGLINVGGTLYGTADGCGGAGFGTVFSVDPATGSEKTVYSFQDSPDGAYPIGKLINVGGTLYGTTHNGGSDNCPSGCGIVFALNPGTGAEYTAYSFVGGFDGAYPWSGLIDVHGYLWGTTNAGGGNQNCPTTGDGCGTVYSLNAATHVEAVIPLFGGSNAELPFENLVDFDGTLYGTSELGGAAGLGTIFSVKIKNSAEEVVHSFQGGNDGAGPFAGLLKVGSLLYGVTQAGGGSSTDCPDGCGTIFSLDPKTGSEQVLYEFQDGGDGATPQGTLIEVDGTLYGTAGNGSKGYGTVFAYTP